MSMDLFIEPTEPFEFEKIGTEVALPEDPNGWPNEILQELYKQVPYIADFEPNVVMDRVDAERGYGFGHVEVMNKTEIQRGVSQEGMQAAGIRQVRIPVIIRDRKLQPFDVIITEDSKMFPLTENRLRSAIFRPQAFDITGRTPGDMSMIGQLYPPYRQNYGFGGGGASMSVGMGKDGAAKTAAKTYSLPIKASCGDELEYKLKHLDKKASILEAILPSINESDYNSLFSQLEDPHLQAAYLANSYATADALSKLASFEPKKSGEPIDLLPRLVKTSVAQVVKVSGGYKLKTASHLYWSPIEKLVDRGEVVERFGEKIALAVDTAGSVTMSEGAKDAVDPEVDRAELIKDFGLYKVKDEQGKELVGWVFPNLLDLDGAALPLALFSNGSQAAIQGEIVGVRSGDGTSLPDGGAPSGKGCFYQTLANGKTQATIPFDIKGYSTEPDGQEAVLGTTFDGRQVELHIDQPNIQSITETPDGDVLIPESFKWLPLGEAAEVSLVEDPAQFVKSAGLQSYLTVEVRAGGNDSFSISGTPVEKLASSQKEFLSFNDATLLLAGFGVEPEHCMLKLGEASYWSRPVEIRINRPIHTSEEMRKLSAEGAAAVLEFIPALRRDLVKEAANIPDPSAVDTILSLGFVNPENLTTFVSYLPKIDEAQSHMCELLIAARLGLREIPTSPLEKAIKSTEEVIEGLKVLAFQKAG